MASPAVGHSQSGQRWARGAEPKSHPGGSQAVAACPPVPASGLLIWHGRFRLLLLMETPALPILPCGRRSGRKAVAMAWQRDRSPCVAGWMLQKRGCPIGWSKTLLLSRRDAMASCSAQEQLQRYLHFAFPLALSHRRLQMLGRSTSSSRTCSVWSVFR